jgi:hypothetical protein
VLNNVVSAVTALARRRVMNDPNAWLVSAFRKRVVRTAGSAMGGAPTLGGLGVLDSEDEAEIEYDFLGHGVALFTEAFQATGATLSDDRGVALAETGEFRALMEPEDPPGHPEWWETHKRDIWYFWCDERPEGPKVAYEIVALEPTLNIPPYAMRYVLNRRDDMAYIGEFPDG